MPSIRCASFLNQKGYFMPKTKPINSLIKSKEGVINISETLFQKRKLFLYDEIHVDSVEALVKEIMLLESVSNDPIELYVSSPGGSVNDGFALIDVIRKSKCKIITIAQGCVASMGSLVFISGHERKFYKHSILMFHDMFGGVVDYSQKMKSRAAFMEKEWVMIENHIKEYAKLSEQDLLEMRSGELWLLAEDALAKGCTDQII